MVGGTPTERPGSSSSPKIEPRSSAPSSPTKSPVVDNMPRPSVEARLKQMQQSHKQEEIKVHGR